MKIEIKVRNLDTGIHAYPDPDALVLSVCEWYDCNEGECQLDVSEDDRLIIMEFIHYGYDDGGGKSSAVIIKDELPDYIDAEDLVLQLKACC